MSKINTISIQGFRSIADLRELRLRPLNILIGANGSGKSNLLEAMKVMRLCVTGGVYEYAQRAGGANRVLHFGTKTTERATFTVKFEGDEGRYKTRLMPDARDNLNSGVTIPASAPTVDFHRLQLAQGGGAALQEFLRGRLERWQAYHFHDTGFTSPMKGTADLHDNRYLRHDGANIASYLYLLKQNHQTAYDLIRKTVRLVAPFFEDFALVPLALNPDKIKLEWRHVGSDDYFDASSLSDGTLRFIALTTVLLQPSTLRPAVILLDEPELGLHPYATTLLAAMVKQTSADSQIVAATQSPTMLDHFRPEDVLVAERENGATGIRRLSGDELAAWLEDYSLGELWEKNEFGGRPGPERAD